MKHELSPATPLPYELLGDREGPCVSLYLPTRAAGQDPHQDRVRLDHLMAQAEANLMAGGVSHVEAAELLAPIRAFCDESLRLAPPATTLAFFAAPRFFRAVHAKGSAREAAVVGPRFHVRPLLALAALPRLYYVLAVSLNQVRLVEVRPEGTRRLPIAGMPASFAAAMGYDEYYSELQVHSASGGGPGRRPAIVHGHGDHDEERLERDLRNWFGRLADAIGAIRLPAGAPRVLATSSEHVALYLATSRDRDLLPAALVGNPDHRTDAELAAGALPLVEAELERRRDEALARWRELLGSDRASGDLRVVLPAACQGRVQALFLPSAGELWGSFDAATGNLDFHVERRPGDEELLTRAATETVRRGGEVYEVPQLATLDGAPLAALLGR